MNINFKAAFATAGILLGVALFLFLLLFYPAIAVIAIILVFIAAFAFITYDVFSDVFSESEWD